MSTTKMAPMISRMTMFCLLSILGGSTVAMEDSVSSSSSSSSHSQHLTSGMGGLPYEEPAEKRAYTYVSEYKRLPVYNFGLGKRALVDSSGEDKRARPYSFGLGKRTLPYSFGLGKRANDNQQEFFPSRMDYLPIETYENYRPRDDNFEELLEGKRGSRLYNFGLGKRGEPWNLAESGKRPLDAISQRYLLGLAKKMMEDEEATQ